VPQSIADIATERLRLRQVTAADVPALVAISTDPRTNRHRPGGAPDQATSERLIREFIADGERDGIGYWTVERAEEVIGIAGVRAATVQGHECWNLYYRFSPSSWGQGLAAEAARQAVAVARAQEPSRPVVARTRPDNAAAARLARAVGLTRRPELDHGGLLAFA
jgi:[ribosomal protein S5]-alanine N-acetyltransferase